MVFRSPSLSARCLLSLYIYGLLQCAFGYVVQVPDTISQTTPDLDQASPESPIAESSLNGTTPNLPQEGPTPPSSFKIEYLWKQGGNTFDPLDFYNAMARDMSVLTAFGWNLALGSMKFRPDFGIQVSFVCDRDAPAMKTKHLVWALQLLFAIIVERDDYATGTIMVYDNGGSQRIAVGSVVTPRTNSAVVNETDVLLAPSPHEYDRSGNNTTSIIVLPSQAQQNSPSSSSSIPQLSSSLGDNKVDMNIRFKPHGADFHDVQIYNATLKLLAAIAEVTNQSAFIFPLIQTYNDMDDFSMTMRPMSFAKGSDLSWRTAAQVLAYLGEDLSKQGVGGEWAELDGLIKLDGKAVGVFCIEKGRSGKEACYDAEGWFAAVGTS